MAFRSKTHVHYQGANVAIGKGQLTGGAMYGDVPTGNPPTRSPTPQEIASAEDTRVSLSSVPPSLYQQRGLGLNIDDY